MDMSAIAARLGLSGSRPVIRKAGELRRLCDVNFNSSVLGIVSGPDCPPSSPISRSSSAARTCL
jgi:hypothetical protein